MSEQTTSIAPRDDAQPMSPAAVVQHVALIQTIMKSVMKQGTHYGIIPGCDKPSLYQPGAEKLCLTFHLAPDFSVEQYRDGEDFRAVAVCRLLGSNGRLLASKVGTASTAEERYAWRRALCNEEYDAAPESERRLKWRRRRDGQTWAELQVRTNPADMANTVAQMAQKRAFVGAVRCATAASDIFTQDVEDLPREYLEQQADDPERASPPPPSGHQAAHSPAPAPSKAAPQTAMVQDDLPWDGDPEPPSGGEQEDANVVLPVGKGRGKTLSECSVAELRGALWYFWRSSTDPQRGRYREENTAWFERIRRELASRRDSTGNPVNVDAIIRGFGRDAERNQNREE